MAEGAARLPGRAAVTAVARREVGPVTGLAGGEADTVHLVAVHGRGGVALGVAAARLDRAVEVRRRVHGRRRVAGVARAAIVARGVRCRRRRAVAARALETGGRGPRRGRRGASSQRRAVAVDAGAGGGARVPRRHRAAGGREARHRHPHRAVCVIDERRHVMALRAGERSAEGARREVGEVCAPVATARGSGRRRSHQRIALAGRVAVAGGAGVEVPRVIGGRARPGARRERERGAEEEGERGARGRHQGASDGVARHAVASGRSRSGQEKQRGCRTDGKLGAPRFRPEVATVERRRGRRRAGRAQR